MPLGLRADVITHVHMSTIAQIPWLEGKEKAFVADVAIALKPRLFMVSRPVGLMAIGSAWLG